MQPMLRWIAEAKRPHASWHGLRSFHKRIAQNDADQDGAGETQTYTTQENAAKGKNLSVSNTLIICICFHLLVPSSLRYGPPYAPKNPSRKTGILGH